VNVVVGLVRDKPATDKKISEDPKLKGRTNIHILQADLTDYNALKVRSRRFGIRYVLNMYRKLLRTRPTLLAASSTTSSQMPASSPFSTHTVPLEACEFGASIR
jgi:hypothetical protein